MENPRKAKSTKKEPTMMDKVEEIKARGGSLQEQMEFILRTIGETNTKNNKPIGRKTP
jgi:hypothetical protein